MKIDSSAEHACGAELAAVPGFDGGKVVRCERRGLAQNTRAKVLLTSRRDEHGWLADLPARVRLPAMPMLERLQLAEALAAKHGRRLLDIDDWRPLLTYTAGNPLTLTVLVGQALRDGLASRSQVEAFVDRLRAGQTTIDDDQSQGRTASLGASLSYGLHAAFTDTEQAQLAVLHLFHNTVVADALILMATDGNPPPVPALAGTTRAQAVALLDRAADVGLLTPLGGGYFTIHPALPWYFTDLFHRHHPAPADETVVHAYTAAIAALGDYYQRYVGQGHHQAVDLLALEEANLLHARRLARTHQQWRQLIGTMQGLRVLYERQGRTAEWARLVDETTPDLTDPATDQPLPDRNDQWTILTGYRVRLATDGRDWPTATRLLTLAADQHRHDAADALATDPTQLTDLDRNRIHTLALDYERLGRVQRERGQASCVDSYQQAMDLYRRIDARREQAVLALNLGRAYLDIPVLRDLDRAEQHSQESLILRAEHDQHGRAHVTGQLGQVAHERFLDARTAGSPATVLAGHLTTAADHYQQALAMLPADAITDRAAIHNQLGNIYNDAGQVDTALTHYQKSISYEEATGNRYGAGQTRYNTAGLLANAGRHTDALAYARAALADFASYGPAADNVEKTRQLIAQIEQAAAGQQP